MEREAKRGRWEGTLVRASLHTGETSICARVLSPGCVQTHDDESGQVQPTPGIDLDGLGLIPNDDDRACHYTIPSS